MHISAPASAQPATQYQRRDGRIGGLPATLVCPPEVIMLLPPGGYLLDMWLIWAGACPGPSPEHEPSGTSARPRCRVGNARATAVRAPRSPIRCRRVARGHPGLEPGQDNPGEHAATHHRARTPDPP